MAFLAAPDTHPDISLDELLVDLRHLVELGLLVEHRAPGEQSRYGLSPLGDDLAASDNEPEDPLEDP
jgi:hypothetical protein